MKRQKRGGLEIGLAFDVEPGASVAAATLVVVKGRSVRLDCVPAASPKPVSVSWLKDDVRLENSSRVQILGNGSLLIDKVVNKKGTPPGGQSDNGVYRCLISSSLGALLSRPTRLRVAGKDFIYFIF
ncbi:hypothetical protein WDU94_006699 [Cyamophila willieti]